MLKNIMYSILAFLIGVFIYNTYIKEDENVEITTEINTRMTGVVYKKDGYKVEADKQSEKDGDNNIYFEKAKAFFENTSIKSNKGILDQKKSDLILSGNVFGKNKANGWEISGNKLNYLQSRNLFYSNDKIEVYNSQKNLSITGDYFESDSDLNNIKLEKNVRAITDKYDLKAYKSSYEEETGMLTLEGNVSVLIKGIEKDGKKSSEVLVHFPKVTYNTKREVLTSLGRFQAEYQGYMIKGIGLDYNNKTQVLNMDRNITIEKEDTYVEFSNGRLQQRNYMLMLNGPIKGRKGTLNFEGNNGYIDTETEDLDLIGKVKFFDEQNKFEAYRVYYEKENDKYKVYGAESRFLYTAVNKKFSSDYGEYYKSKNLLIIPNKFYFESTLEDGKRIDGEGENISFNTLDESGSSDNTRFNMEGNYLEATKVLFDFKSAYHYLKDGVVGKYDKYSVSGSTAELDERNQRVYIPKDYKIIDQEDNIKIHGKDVVIDNIKETIVSNKRTYLAKDDFEASGNNFNYNYMKEKGNISGNIHAYNRVKNLEMTGSKAEFNKDENFKLYEKVKLNQKGYNAETEEVTYDFNKEKVNIPKEINMWSASKELKGKSTKGVYDVNTQVYKGEEYSGQSKQSTMKGDFVTYTLSKEEVYLEGNIEVEDKNTDMMIKTDELYYYKASEYAVAPKKIKVIRDNILLEGESGNVNIKDKQIEFKSPVLTTTLGDKVSGDKLYGDYNKNEFDFSGNINGEIYTVNEAQLNGEEDIDYTKPLKFSGELAKLFFVKDINGNLMATRSEIRDESRFVYNNMIMEGDYLEAQGSTQKLFAKGNSIITIQDLNKISAESITLDMLTEEAEMRNNVSLTSIGKEEGGINTKADYAYFNSKDNKVDLKGNIESYKGKTKFVADQGVFDLEKSTLSGKGNIFLSLDFETLEQSKARQKQEDEANEKIVAAMEKVEIPSEIESDVETIKLSNESEDVNIHWKSNDESIIDLNGSVYHKDYTEKDEIVKLTGVYMYGDYSQNKDYYIRVLKEGKKSYLSRSIESPKISLEEKKMLYESNNYNSKLTKFDKSIFDNFGNILDLEKLENTSFSINYYLEDININKTYKVLKEKDTYKVEEEVKSVEEHSSAESTKDIQ